ncbi:MAG: hypothetical protein IH892_04875 [Planctomycetes bacterium]|nr:hypothetical protein [Planctomycetota bacterium]
MLACRQRLIAVVLGVASAIQPAVMAVESRADAQATRTLIKKVIAALERHEVPFSGRGSGTYRQSGQRDPEKNYERAMKFVFKGSSSRVDQSLVPGNSRPEVATILVRTEKRTLHYSPERLYLSKPENHRFGSGGMDLHPDVFEKLKVNSIAKFLTRLIESPASRLTVLRAHVTETNLVDVVIRWDADRTYSEYQFKFDPGKDLRLVFGKETSIPKGQEGKSSSDTFRLDWKQYGENWFVSSFTSHWSKGTQEVQILEFDPTAVVDDKEFTIAGIAIPNGHPVYDGIVDTKYHFGKSSDAFDSIDTSETMVSTRIPKDIRRILVSHAWIQSPLREVLSDLRESAQFTIVVDSSVKERVGDAQVTFEAIGLGLQEVLEEVLMQVGLTYEVDDYFVRVTSWGSAVPDSE